MQTFRSKKRSIENAVPREIAGLWFLPLCWVFLLCSIPSALWSADWIYTVRPGDNLWNITERYAVSMRYWEPLRRLNQVQRPRNMPPGMRIRIPVDWLRLKPVPARITHVAGDARHRSSKSSTARPATAGAVLQLGDSVETGPAGSLTIEFADGSRLLVRPGSRLRLDTLRAYDGTGMVDTHLRLEHGGIESKVRPSVGPGSRFEIHTPAATASVRGTDLRVGSGGSDKITRVEVVEGRVGVTGKRRTRSVTEGFGIVVEPDKTPRQPRPLLPAPEFESPVMQLDRIPLRLRWSDVPGAVAYQVQVASDPRFETLLVDARTLDGGLPGIDLPDGHYALRVRAIDDSGLEGLDASARIELDARPEPPFAVAPGPGQVVRTAMPVFSWSEPAAADGYLFQLAKAPDFTDLILEMDDLAKPEAAAPTELVPGQYHWRIATRAGGEVGPFSDPQEFILRPAPESPALETPELGDERLALRWRAGTPGQRFEYQLARDTDFRQVIFSAITEAPEASVPKPDFGEYFIRIRTIDTDGFAGPFGPHQRLYIPPDTFWPAVVPIVLGIILVIL